MAPRLFSAVLAAAAAGAASAATLPGTLVGIYAPPGNPLTQLEMLSIDPNTGANATIATVNVGPIKTTFPGKSALNNDTNELIIFCATSDGVYSFDTTTGKGKQLAPLPPYDETDPYLGVVYIGGTVYLITQNAFWSVEGGQVTKLVALEGFPSVAQVTANPNGGTDGKGIVYVGQTDGTAIIYTIDLGAAYAQGSIKSSISSLWDLQYSSYLGSLIGVAGYQLYTINAASGATKKVAAIVDGSGYPKMNTMSPDGRYFAFLDFDLMHVIDLNGYAYVGEGPFLWAPRSVGFPAWIPAA